MKKILKIQFIVLITFGIVLPTIISVNLYKISKDKDDFSIDLKNLKISKLSSKIHIIGNSGWFDFKNAGNCIGTGISSDPYIIEDLVIDSGGPGNCIEIEDSDVYFKIENCTIYNSGSTFFGDGGIRLVNVTYGIVTNNTCTSIYKGIYVGESDNIIISGNRANNNSDNGIYLWYSMNSIISGNIVNYNGNDGIYLHDNCYKNNVSGNTVNNNNDDGIYIIYSNDNNITGNIINNNGDDGIFLRGSNNNIVSGNTLIGNQECITEEECQENVFNDNGSCNYGEGDKVPVIQGYNIIFLFGALLVLSIILQKKMMKSLKTN